MAAPSATRTTVSAFGAIAGIAGFEHGVGEVLQGSIAPSGVMIQSWAGSDLYDILNGEPAMTLVPNLLASGLLTILVASLFFVWVTAYIGRRDGPYVLLVLSFVLLLVGGGFGPPILGLILSATATAINSPLRWWRTRVSPAVRRTLGALWPCSFGAALVAWLLLFPGSILLDHYLGIGDPYLFMGVASSCAFGFLVVTIFAAFARDVCRQPGGLPQPSPTD